MIERKRERQWQLTGNHGWIDVLDLGSWSRHLGYIDVAHHHWLLLLCGCSNLLIRQVKLLFDGAPAIIDISNHSLMLLSYLECRVLRSKVTPVEERLGDVTTQARKELFIVSWHSAFLITKVQTNPWRLVWLCCRIQIVWAQQLGRQSKTMRNKSSS